MKHAFDHKKCYHFPMTQVLQKAIESLNNLSEAEQNQIATRLLEEIENLHPQKAITQDEWDMELERDLNAGHLDALMAEALEDYKAGRVSKR
jgi:hypothetical protein